LIGIATVQFSTTAIKKKLKSIDERIDGEEKKQKFKPIKLREEMHRPLEPRGTYLIFDT
jgi:hypothetical protein